MSTLQSWEGFTVGHGDNIALVVEPPSRFQAGGTCWVFGLGRHLNGMCRIRGLFFRNGVCFHSFYLGVEASVALLEGGGIPDVGLARDFLVNHGLPLESANWMQVQLRPMIAVRDMIVHRPHEYANYGEFMQHLFSLLPDSSIAVLVPSFPSLCGPPHPNGLHYPTLAERRQIHKRFHLMLATGRGTLEGRLPYLQFQDSMVETRGMVNLLLEHGSITLFVEMINPYDNHLYENSEEIEEEDNSEENEEDDYSSEEVDYMSE